MAVSPAPPAPKHHHRIRLFVVFVVVGVVVILLVAELSDYLYERRPGGPINPYEVKVSAVTWTLNGTAWASSPGFSLPAGAQVTVWANAYCAPIVYNIVQRTCTSGEIYLLTPGFVLVYTNAPLQWSSYNTGADANVTAVVSLPTSSFAGDLTIALH